jgi:transposase-like protein
MPPERLDRAHAAEVAAASREMTEFLSRMGEDLDRATRRRWSQRFRRWRIDTSHWVRSPRRRYSDEELARAVAQSVSCAEVLRRLGISLAGGSQAYLSRRIKATGLDTSHFLGRAHRRGQPAERRLTPEQVLRVLVPGSYRIKAPQLRRALMAMGVPELCEECAGTPEWCGKTLRLIVDHRNGDWLDNRLENLRFLCPNCHAQTATWCRRWSARPRIE